MEYEYKNVKSMKLECVAYFERRCLATGEHKYNNKYLIEEKLNSIKREKD